MFLLFIDPLQIMKTWTLYTAGLPPMPLLMFTWFFYCPKASREGPWREQCAKVPVKSNFFNYFEIHEKLRSCIHLIFCSDHAAALPLKPPLSDPLFSSKVPFLNVPNIIKNGHPRCSHSTFSPKLAFPSETCCYVYFLTTPLGREGQFWSTSALAAARINILLTHDKLSLGPHLASSRNLPCPPLGFFCNFSKHKCA